MRGGDCVFVKGASAVGTFSIHFKKVDVGGGVDFKGDAKKILDMLVLACPCGTIVELWNKLGEELKK